MVGGETQPTSSWISGSTDPRTRGSTIHRFRHIHLQILRSLDPDPQTHTVTLPEIHRPHTHSVQGIYSSLGSLSPQARPGTPGAQEQTEGIKAGACPRNIWEENILRQRTGGREGVGKEKWGQEDRRGRGAGEELATVEKGCRGECPALPAAQRGLYRPPHPAQHPLFPDSF